MKRIIYIGLIFLSACGNNKNSEFKRMFKNYELDIKESLPFHELVDKYFYEPNRLLSDTSFSSPYNSNKISYKFYKHYLGSNWEIKYYVRRNHFQSFFPIQISFCING